MKKEIARGSGFGARRQKIPPVRAVKAFSFVLRWADWQQVAVKDGSGLRRPLSSSCSAEPARGVDELDAKNCRETRSTMQ